MAGTKTHFHSDRNATPDLRSFAGEVDVFGEASDNSEYLGQGGAALEKEVRFEVWDREEAFESPADPKILLDQTRTQIHLARRL